MQRKAVIESMPRALHITLTDRCNIKCRFCYQGELKNEWEMPEKACNEIMGLFPYLQRLVWQGGEAFMHPRFMEMLTESSKFPNIEEQTIATNALMIDEKWVEIFSEIPKFQVVVSMESVNKSVYEDLHRGGKFDLLEKNIGLLAEVKKKYGSKINLSMNALVMRSTYHGLEDMVDFAVKYGFSNIIINPLCRNGSEFYEREYVSPCEPEVEAHFKNVMPSILEKANRHNICFHDRYSVSNRRQGEGKNGGCSSDEDKQGGDENDSLLCHAPWQQLFIHSGGDVSFYCYCHNIIGNIKDNPVSAMWNNEIIQKKRRDMMMKDYAGCALTCTGGFLDEGDLKLR